MTHTKMAEPAEIVCMSLRSPGETRWNATYDAVKRLLDPRVRDKLPKLTDTLKLPQFSKMELETLEEYAKFMAPIAEALDRLQGEQQCYLGLFMPTMQQVVKKLMVCASTLTHCRVLAEALANAVEGRFQHVFSFSTESKVYAAAAACHPKIKLRWVADVRKDWVKEAFLSEARNITPAVSEDDHWAYVRQVSCWTTFILIQLSNSWPV